MSAAVKHQPATPLPWLFGEYKHGIEVVQQGALTPVASAEVCETDEDEARAKQNLAYIAHAANAYPKLVEALRKSEHANDCSVRGDDGRVWKREEFCTCYRTLLRELGEAA